MVFQPFSGGIASLLGARLGIHRGVAEAEWDAVAFYSTVVGSPIAIYAMSVCYLIEISLPVAGGQEISSLRAAASAVFSEGIAIVSALDDTVWWGCFKAATRPFRSIRRN